MRQSGEDDWRWMHQHSEERAISNHRYTGVLIKYLNYFHFFLSNILNAFKIRPILLILLRVEVFHTEAKIELIVTEFNLNKLKKQSYNFAKC